MTAKQMLKVFKAYCAKRYATHNRPCIGCGIQTFCNNYIAGLSDSYIDRIIKLAEEISKEMYPDGGCPNCGNGFDAMLTRQYRITHCPWCGEEITGGTK